MQWSPCGPLIWRTSSDNSQTTKRHYRNSTLLNGHSSSFLTCLLVVMRAGILPTTQAPLVSTLRTPRKSSIARYPIDKLYYFPCIAFTLCVLSQSTMEPSPLYEKHVPHEQTRKLSFFQLSPLNRSEDQRMGLILERWILEWDFFFISSPVFFCSGYCHGWECMAMDFSAIILTLYFLTIFLNLLHSRLMTTRNESMRYSTVPMQPTFESSSCMFTTCHLLPSRIVFFLSAKDHHLPTVQLEEEQKETFACMIKRRLTTSFISFMFRTLPLDDFKRFLYCGKYGIITLINQRLLKCQQCLVCRVGNRSSLERNYIDNWTRLTSEP